ncbi:MAG: hypothetical protein HRT35_14710 [Algicola sp.]|nr:hypothetical protein [Algicola sp.]
MKLKAEYQFHRFLLLTLLLMLPGCASIPLTTMAHFSGFGPQDIIEIKARELRVKATINASLGIELVKATTLSLGVKTSQGEVSLILGLQALKQQTIAAKTGFFSSSPAFSVQYMKLSEQGIIDFEKFQQLVKSKSVKGGSFGAGMDHSNGDKDQKTKPVDETVYFSVAIKLAKGDDFVALIDRFEIEGM